MMDEFDAAVGELSPLQDREQEDLEYLFMLGISYGKLKRTDDARRTFARLVQSGGDTPHLHLLLGKAYLGLGDFPSAAPELEKAAAGDPRLPYSHYYLGVLDEKLGKLDAAAAQFEKETEISPNDPWAFEDLSRIKLNQGDTDGVIGLLERARMNH
jgi:tetratricopeptide (TPR) repeat protein